MAISFRYFLEAYTPNKMTEEEALRIFGPNAARMTPDMLKAKYRQLSMKSHKDSGGNYEQFKKVKQAYDILSGVEKSSPTTGHPPESTTDYSHETREVPPWEPDKRAFYSKINKPDFSNINYLKYRIWHEALSKGIDGTYHISAFDGGFLRAEVTVYGNENEHVLGLMGKAVAFWNSHGGNPYHSEAVIVGKKSWGNKVRLVWVLGKDVTDKNIWIEHDSFNMNPGNDSQFVKNLKKKISELNGIDTYG